MNLITVIPITRSKVDELTYFTAAEAPVGAIVSVPLRSKTIDAIVIESRPVADAKSEIKNASFEIKKLSKVKAVSFFPASFIRGCASLADYYATSTGSIIRALVSQAILDQAGSIAAPIAPSSVTNPSVGEVRAVQGDDDDRVSAWRSLIRQEFARKKSILMHLPTIEDAVRMHAALSKGIEGYIYLLHTGMTDKAVTTAWKSLAENTHAVLVVTAGGFPMLPRTDVETVVIERENGRGWISQRMPYLDGRRAAEALARAHRQTIYLADCLLRAETLHRTAEHELAEGSPFKWRSVSTATDTLISMKKPAPQRRESVPAFVSEADEKAGQRIAATAPEKDYRFRVISPELEHLIRDNREESSHLFIFASRRGSAPITVCADCETVVMCQHCTSPVVLHSSRDTGRNYFMCHACGARRSAAEYCVTCGGWRLTPLGIGIDRVVEEINRIFPDAEVFKMDADTAKTKKDANSIIDKFRTKPGSILVGTEMSLAYLHEHVEHVAVATMDSLFALPDFRIQEKIMYTLVRLRALATRSILVQTRRPEEKVFEYGLKGNLSDFYRSLIDERKQFAYPPFSTLIKITIEGVKDAISAEMANITKLVEPREIDIFPAFTATVRGKSVIHGLIKIPTRVGQTVLSPSASWPDPDLVARLRTLPMDVSVKIDPESML